MLRLDYLSCVLTIASTVLVGRRCWEGWALAGVNSVLICVIGLRTEQLGFIPANVFCMVMSATYSAINRFSANGHCSSIHCASQRNPALRAVSTISWAEYLWLLSVQMVSPSANSTTTSDSGILTL